MAIVHAAGFDVATIGSRFHYVLADGTQGNGIPQLPPQLMLPWNIPDSNFTLSWDSLSALLPAAFSMAMLGAIGIATVCRGVRRHDRHQTQRQQ